MQIKAIYTRSGETSFEDAGLAFLGLVQIVLILLILVTDDGGLMLLTMEILILLVQGK